MQTKEFINTLIENGFSEPSNCWENSWWMSKGELVVYINFCTNEETWEQEVVYSAFYNPENEYLYQSDECTSDSPEEIIEWILSFTPEQVELKEENRNVKFHVNGNFSEEVVNQMIRKCLAGTNFKDIEVS